MKTASLRSGRICVVGRANTGKSTLINSLLGRQLHTVTHRSQTTRQALASRFDLNDHRLVLVDTPGLHRHKRQENRLMNKAALAETEGASLVLAVFDRSIFRRDDAYLVKHCAQSGGACIAVINKMDLLRDKAKVLPRIAALHQSGAFAHIVPVSSACGDNLPELTAVISRLIPAGEQADPADVPGELPNEFFVTEAIREQLLLRYRREVPHDIRLKIEKLQCRPGRIMAKVRLFVRREGQKRILLGRGGGRLRALCAAARAQVGARLQVNAQLELDVSVERKRQPVAAVASANGSGQN